MKLEEIKKAVEEGRQVYWKTTNYQVTKDRLGQFHVVCKTNDNAIGLTHQDGVTMNGDEADFWTPHAFTYEGTPFYQNTASHVHTDDHQIALLDLRASLEEPKDWKVFLNQQGRIPALAAEEAKAFAAKMDAAAKLAEHLMKGGEV